MHAVVFERYGGPEGLEYVEGGGPSGGGEAAVTIAGSGERVAWSHVAGSYAEKVAAPRDKLVPVPDGVSSDDAAAAILQGMTAHYLAFDSYPVEEGDWVV